MSGRRGTEKKTRVSVSPPPSPSPSPPRRGSSQPRPLSLASASSSSSASSSAPIGRAEGLAAIPPGIAGIVSGFQDRKSRVASNRASARLGAVLEASCTVESCLAPQVRDTCRGVCEQRGVRLIQQAVAADPRVLREFAFESRTEYPDRERHEHEPRRVHFTSRPTVADDDDDDDDDDGPPLSHMGLTFSWDRFDWIGALRDTERSRSKPLDSLYLADGKEARDLKALIDRVRQQPTESSLRTPLVLRDLNELYERFRVPTTVGELTRQLSEIERADADDREDRDWRAEQQVTHTQALREVYRRATGRRLVWAVPSGAPIRYAAAWVTDTISSLFRDGSSGGWRIESTNLEHDPKHARLTLHLVAPLADVVGTLFARLLSEPPDAFSRLSLAPIGANPSKTVRTAAARLREGVRVWRGADLVTDRFSVDDVEFHRQYPEVARLARRARDEEEEEEEEKTREAEREKREEKEGVEERRASTRGGEKKSQR